MENKLGKATNNFHPGANAFIVAGAGLDGKIKVSYTGNRKQLTVLFRRIRDELREKESIGNHPTRGDVEAMRIARIKAEEVNLFL